jgi:hypothetical protein
MRSTILPAQITTVEDTIAGGLTLKQFVILLIPIFWGTIVFALFPPSMKVVFYKIPFAVIVLCLSLILSYKFKGKMIASWLGVILRYNMRPGYYIYNKNDAYMRNIPLPDENKNEQKETVKKSKEMLIPAKTFGLKELRELEAYIKNPNYSFSLKPNKKGGLYVAIAQIQK